MNKTLYRLYRKSNILLNILGFTKPKEVKNAFYAAHEAEEYANNQVNNILKDIENSSNLIRELENNQNLAYQEYKKLKDLVPELRTKHNPEIKRLNGLQKAAWLNMKDRFDRASEAYHKRDGALAKELSIEGHQFENEAKQHVKDRKALVKEIKDTELKRDEALAEVRKIKKEVLSNKKKLVLLKSKVLVEAEENLTKVKNDHNTLKKVNSVVDFATICPNLCHIALDHFEKYYKNEYLPNRKKDVKNQSREEWIDESGAKIKVKNYISADYGCWTTDIIIVPPEAKDGLHLHIGFSEFGEELFSDWKTNK